MAGSSPGRKIVALVIPSEPQASRAKTVKRRRFKRQSEVRGDFPSVDFIGDYLLRTVREYNAAVAEVDRLLDANPKKGSDEYDRLEFLSVLIEAYENEHVPEPRDPTPQEAVDFFLEQRGMTRAQLANCMGGRSRVSDFFKGVRPLSTSQVKALRDLLGVPADLLIA